MVVVVVVGEDELGDGAVDVVALVLGEFQVSVFALGLVDSVQYAVGFDARLAKLPLLEVILGRSA